MIRENASWIHLLAPNHRDRIPKIAGKWLCFGPTLEMHLFRDLLDVLVSDGVFLSAKIARKDPATDPFPHKDCVICIYTSSDPSEKDRAKAKLVEIGLKPAAWKSEQQTKADWSPGGKLEVERQLVQKKRELQNGDATSEFKRSRPRFETSGWHVFISKSSSDAAAARQVYDFLIGQGLRVFLSEVALGELGEADYARAIESALDTSEHFVVVTSSKATFASEWVQAECRMFLNELRSGRKKGNVLSVLAGAMRIDDLPISLRAYQVERLTDAGLQSLLRFVGRKQKTE